MNAMRVGWFTPNYKLMTPTYKRLGTMLRPGIVHSSRLDQIIECVNGGGIEFWTLGDKDAGRSRFYDWVIIDEASLVQKDMKDIWEQAIAPTLLDRGGNAVMAGTPKGINPENYFYEACNAKEHPKDSKTTLWEEYHAPTWCNPTLNEAEVSTLQDKYPPLVYQQEYCADFVDWSGEAFFLLENMLENGKPCIDPGIIDTVFATIDTAAKDGKENDGTAVCYWGFRKLEPQKLYLLDWDIVQIKGALLVEWLPGVYQRLESYTKRWKVRFGSSGVLIEDRSSGVILIQQAVRNGWPVKALDGDLTQLGKTARAINISGNVYQKQVVIMAEAYNKTVNYRGNSRNHFLSQVTGFRIGQKDEEDDLLDAFCYGVAVALGDRQGFKG